jgi:hypothetical protein
MICGERLKWRGFWLGKIDLGASSATIVVNLPQWFHGSRFLGSERECGTIPIFSQHDSRVSNRERRCHDDHHDRVENDESELVISQIAIVAPHELKQTVNASNENGEDGNSQN